MTKTRHTIAQSTIYALRKVFYNTPLQHLAVTGYVYDKVFLAGAPDLNEPVNFRKTRLYVDPNDRSYVPAVVGGYYEKRELDIFEQLARKSTTFMDIGANIGMYSMIAAGENPSIACFAFEPVKENQVIFKKNLKLNKLQSQVTLVTKAVSDHNGKATIHLSEKLSGTHSLSVSRGGGSRSVSIVSVDSYCNDESISPDLIKIDVEGHEGSVLRGMKNILNTKPTIFMEYIPSLNKDMKDNIQQLSKLYPDCYVVSAVNSNVIKMKTSEINLQKMYNIILSSSKKHQKIIDGLLSEKKNGVSKTKS